MLNAVALKQLIEGSGVFYKENSVSFIFTCPRCSKNRKLYIRKKDGIFRCFKCADSGFKGKAEYALAELLNQPINEIRTKLYGDITLNKSKQFIKLELKDFYGDNDEFGYEEDDNEGVELNPEFVGPKHKDFAKGREYFYSRGINDEHIETYNLMYHPKWSCVVFPVIENGILIGWQERAINRDFRYTLKGFKKDRTLMFMDRLIGSKHAVLTEGPVDGIKAHLCGGNVVSMGKGVSDYQIDILLNRVQKIYLGLDPDAWKDIDRVCRKAYGKVDVYHMPPSKGFKDLGEMAQEQVLEEFLAAKKLFNNFFTYLKG